MDDNFLLVGLIVKNADPGIGRVAQWAEQQSRML